MTPPARIGRYRIEGEIGRGGMGVVYSGFDERLDRPVAIKTIAPDKSDDTLRRRFLREARAAARVRHPNLVHIYEISDDAEELFIAMELLDGESLAGRLARGPLALTQAIPIATDVLSALAALHDQGIVHRDLKPSNIFLESTHVKILDFGLALAVPGLEAAVGAPTESQLTQPGAIAGTPSYMAPEQFKGLPADVRTDLFALGATLFEMLTAKRAFPGHSSMEVYHKTLYEAPPALTGSAAVAIADRVIRRALAKRPQDRYQSAREMSGALQEAAALPTGDGDVPLAHTVTRLMALPFRMLRPDEETEFLCFSIPDAITTALMGLEALVVRSSAAAARFASDSPDLKSIAEDADVDVVLTGTLVRVGEGLRASAQLVGVPSGTLLWSHNLQLTTRDLFQLQDQLVDRIVSSLALSLTAREHRRVKGDVPGSATAYEFFLRGNQLVAPQGLASTSKQLLARDLYKQSIEEDPHFAPAWARLGRCYWLIAKVGEDKQENVRRAEDCFRKALELNPELSLTHTLYALLEIDQGCARDAMIRLIARGLEGGNHPELFAALVQACRFCGLLEASVAAYERAVALDREVITSVCHTYWHLGDDTRALEAMKAPGYLDPLIIGMRGEPEEALRLIEKREPNAPKLVTNLLGSLRGVLQHDRELCLVHTQPILDACPDPEFTFHVCRNLAYFGEKRALSELSRSLERGYVSYRALVRDDPWLDPLRREPEFVALTARAKACYDTMLRAYVEAGGEKLLVPAARMRH